MTRAQDVRFMTNGWNSVPIVYGAYTGRGRFKQHTEWALDGNGNRILETHATLDFDATQLPIVQDSDVTVDGTVWKARQVRVRGDGLLSIALLAKA